MSSSTPSKQSEEFPFPGTLPLKKTSQTIVNPEGRDEEEGSDYAQTLITQPDSTIQQLLFPDFSQWSSEKSLPSPAGIRLGHFEITDRIGAGGMGSVFLAKDLHLQRYVALKILSPTQAVGGTSIPRFINEARAAARLDYDGISRVFYYGEDKGFHFIAFEYVTGINIREMIHSRGPLPSMEVLNYVLQLAHALKQTSAAGVVHRDIKPSNIIVGPSGRVKLVDLGLARKESTETMDELTVAGTTLGTFDYISPEQAKDPRNVDIRSDIYSLGCTLYHMLTGEPPYPDGTLAQKLLEHQHEYVPDPTRKNRKVSARLATITQKMMASDPAKRHQTPEAVIRDLLEVAEHEGLQGVTTEGLVWTGNNRRFGKDWLIRNASWIAAGVVLLLIVFSLDFFATEPESLSVASSENVPKVGIDRSQSDPDHDEISSSSDDQNLTGQEQLIAPPPKQVSESVQGSLPSSTDPSFSEGVLDPSKPFEDPFDPLNLFPPLTSTEDDPGVFIPTDPNTSLPKIPEPKIDDRSPPKGGDPVIVGVKEFPVLMRSPSGQESNYQTLEAACAEARDGCVIELRYNGRREGPSEKPILINGDLTVRAGLGFHPLISFVSTENPDPNDARMITLQGGSLDLEGVEIELNIQHSLRDVAKDEWVIFSLPEAEKLRLTNVVLTIQNFERHQPATFLLAGRGTDLERMNLKQMPPVGTTEGVIPFEVEISNSLFRGEADGILLEHIRPGQIQFVESMLLLENSLLVNRGSSDMPDEFSDVQISLNHVTCVTGNSPYRMDSGRIPREILPIHVASENSLYYLQTIGLAPFVSMSGETNSSDFSESFAWSGIQNYYRGFQTFRTIIDTRGFSSLEDLDFENWEEYWTTEERGSETSPVSNDFFWQSTWQDEPYSRLIPEQFKLEEPLIVDGQPIGLSIESLPVPYEARTLNREPEPEFSIDTIAEPSLDD